MSITQTYTYTVYATSTYLRELSIYPVGERSSLNLFMLHCLGKTRKKRKMWWSLISGVITVLKHWTPNKYEFKLIIPVEIQKLVFDSSKLL